MLPLLRTESAQNKCSGRAWDRAEERDKAVKRHTHTHMDMDGYTTSPFGRIASCCHWLMPTSSCFTVTCQQKHSPQLWLFGQNRKCNHLGSCYVARHSNVTDRARWKNLRDGQHRTPPVWVSRSGGYLLLKDLLLLLQVVKVLFVGSRLRRVLLPVNPAPPVVLAALLQQGHSDRERKKISQNIEKKMHSFLWGHPLTQLLKCRDNMALPGGPLVYMPHQLTVRSTLHRDK